MASQHAHWDEFERGVELVRVVLKATAEEVFCTMEMIATFNMHSMARFLERAFAPADHDALLGAIWNLLPDAPAILAGKTAQFHLDIPEAGGSWHGYQVFSNWIGSTQPKRLSLDVRTFYSEESGQDE